ncbi:MAG TPA: TPM domain-containing protein [Candidatus Nitrosotalea sp.]|nr:TPM domain-containing protein [Candidatus Nitrosotalea sp.]
MTPAEQESIAQAIREAESGTNGRIAVRVIFDDETGDAFERAQGEFRWIGLHGHEPANAALILVAPNARRFAVLGDRALHERVGDAFWDDVVRSAQPYFSRGETAEGVRYAVGRIGEALQTNFAQSGEGGST